MSHNVSSFVAWLKNTKAVVLTAARKATTTEATSFSTVIPNPAATASASVVLEKGDCVDNRRRNRPLLRNQNKHRPGSNSYLHVLLDDQVLDALYNLSIKIQEDNIIQDIIVKLDKDEEQRKKEISTVRYKSRKRSSLHMTFFFGGETLCKLPKRELQIWFDSIKNRLYKSGFYQHQEHYSTNTNTNTTSSSSSATTETLQSWYNNIRNYYYKHDSNINNNALFRITRLRLFPPGENYLIVAELEAVAAASEALENSKFCCWYNLHNDIRQIAMDSTNPNVNDLYKRNTYKSNKEWIPHITLGNVSVIASSDGERGSLLLNKSQQLYIDKKLTELLLLITASTQPTKSSSSSSSSSSLMLCCRANGITMGGQIPEQIPDLNWEFKLKVQT